MAYIPVKIPTRRHACSRSQEPKPDHRRRGRYLPLPPRLNPSPNPWTMASKLPNNSESSAMNEGSSNQDAHRHQVAPNQSPEQSNQECSSGPIFQVAVRTRARGGRGREGGFLLGLGLWVPGGCSSGGGGGGGGGACAIISTVRKGLAFPVLRPILLASLIGAVPNCAALMGFRPATLLSRLSPPFFSFPRVLCVLRTGALVGLWKFLFLLLSTRVK